MRFTKFQMYSLCENFFQFSSLYDSVGLRPIFYILFVCCYFASIYTIVCSQPPHVLLIGESGFLKKVEDCNPEASAEFGSLSSRHRFPFSRY